MSQVFVSWLHGENNKAHFTEAMCGLLAYDSVVRPGEGKPRQIAALRGFDAGVNISGPRNEVVRQFLENAAWGDWHLSIDVDMQFPPDAVERLLEHADPEKAPIVGGLCFGATDGLIWPTIYQLADTEDGPQFIRAARFPLDPPLLKVSGTGGAFLMVHRSAYEAMLARQFSKGFPWFQETELPASPVSEDLTFCLRAGLCGLPVHVLTSLHIGHIKPTLLNAYRYFKQEGLVVESDEVPEAPAAAVVDPDTLAALAARVKARAAS